MTDLPDETARLELHDVACARGGVVVLEEISFTLSPGQALALRGPNGIGKTTLLRMIAGLQPPVSGHVVLPAESQVLATHADGVKLTLTVEENLRFWGQVFGTRRIDDALSAFDLAELADRPAHALSAGQRRRLGLARLLVTDRPIWLLDEPTVSLDVASVRQFARVVEHHLTRGGSALIATHVDLGFEMEAIDLSRFRANPRSMNAAFNEAFL